MLTALADLAERAGARPMPVLCLVLWILRPAEAIARQFMAGLPLQETPPASVADDTAPGAPDPRAEALRLAVAFRALAAMLHGLLATAAPRRSQVPAVRQGARAFLSKVSAIARQAAILHDTS